MRDDCKSLKQCVEKAAFYYYQAEPDFCASVSNSLLAKYKGQIATKFSASYHQMRISICSKKEFRTEDAENIIECFNEEFERFVMSRLKWTSKPKTESGHIV